GERAAAVRPELAPYAEERESGDVGGAAGAVTLAEVYGRRERLARPADDLQEIIRDRPSLRAQRGIDERENGVELNLLDVLRGVDAEASDAQARERDQVAGDLLADRGQTGVEIGQPEQFAIL